MAALRDAWRAAREVRQQEVVKRREEVQTNLQDYQQIRSQNAAEMRQVLAENYAAIQAETHLFLAQVQQRRQAQAKRTAIALREFDAELRETVAAIRTGYRKQMQMIKQYVIDLQLKTQETLAEYPRDRAIMRGRQQQELAQFVAQLEVSVADYLKEVAEVRQMIAVEDQAQRHRDREALTAEVESLRAEFIDFRQQLKAFREDLRQSVWGDAELGPIASATAKKSPQATGNTQQSASSRKLSANAKSTSAKTTSKAPPSNQSNGSTSAIPIEEAVFDYLQTHSEGARLTEIESTLGINRFQAVDALRSLIQKELIVQKDRTYCIQEEAVL